MRVDCGRFAVAFCPYCYQITLMFKDAWIFTFMPANLWRKCRRIIGERKVI